MRARYVIPSRSRRSRCSRPRRRTPRCSATLDVGARLIQQPPRRPWEVDLLLGGKVDAAGEEVPATTNLSFALPARRVNTAAVAGVCPTIRPGVFLAPASTSARRSRRSAPAPRTCARAARPSRRRSRSTAAPAPTSNFKLIVKGEAGAPLTVSARRSRARSARSARPSTATASTCRSSRSSCRPARPCGSSTSASTSACTATSAAGGSRSSRRRAPARRAASRSR